jgi:hypothetical protein
MKVTIRTEPPVVVPVVVDSTVVFENREVSVLKSVGGMARSVTELLSETYKWNEEDRKAVQAVLLELYYNLMGPVFNDRRRGA